MPIKWTDDLLVGIKVIDNQHRNLIEKLEELNLAIHTGESGGKLVSMMDFLGEYVQKHFRLEEAYMVKYKYPGFFEHRALHEGFVKRFEMLKKKLRAEGPTISVALELQKELIAWFIDHISDVDKMVGRYLVKQGIYRM